MHQEFNRSYLIHLPPSYNHASEIGLPLILNLHGFTSNAYFRMFGSLMNAHSDNNDYIAVYPQGTSYGSVDLNDSSFEFTSWNDLGCSGSPSSDGPTCSESLDFPFEDGNSLLPEQCQDMFGCNWCNCLADD